MADEELARNATESLSESLVLGDVPPEVTLHRRKMTEPNIDHSDLWDIDGVAQEACGHGHYMVPTHSGHYELTGGLDASQMVGSPIQRHRRRASTASNPFGNELADEEADIIKERLHGYVRASSHGEAPSSQHHRRTSSMSNVFVNHIVGSHPPQNRRRTSTESSMPVASELADGADSTKE